MRGFSRKAFWNKVRLGSLVSCGRNEIARRIDIDPAHKPEMSLVVGPFACYGVLTCNISLHIPDCSSFGALSVRSAVFLFPLSGAILCPLAVPLDLKTPLVRLPPWPLPLCWCPSAGLPSLVPQRELLKFTPVFNPEQLLLMEMSLLKVSKHTPQHHSHPPPVNPRARARRAAEGESIHGFKQALGACRIHSTHFLPGPLPSGLTGPVQKSPCWRPECCVFIFA